MIPDKVLLNMIKLVTKRCSIDQKDKDHSKACIQE